MVTAKTGNIFVTGATGFLGSHFVRGWLSHGDGHVFALTRCKECKTDGSRLAAALETARLACEACDTVPAQLLTSMEGDVTRSLCGIAPDDLACLREASVESFWHFASDLRYEEHHYEATRRTNVEGARHAVALAAAMGAKRFLYISTAFVCGRQSGLIEEMFAPPQREFSNGYEASKAEAEQLLAVECERLQLRLTILRPSIVIGPRASQSADGSETGLISLIQAVMWIRSRESGRAAKLRIPACADAELNFIPVDCVVADMLALARTGYGDRCIYHLTASSSVTVKKCWQAIADVAGMHHVTLVPPGSWQPSPVERLVARRVGFFLSYIDRDRRFVRSLSPAWRLDAAEFAGYVQKAMERVEGAAKETRCDAG